MGGRTPGVGSPLRARIMLGMTLVTGLMMAAIFVVLPHRLDAAAMRTAQETARGALQLVQGAIEPGLARHDAADVTRALGTLGRVPDAVYAQVIDDEGHTLGRFAARPQPPGWAPPVAPQAVGAHPVVWVEEGGDVLHGAILVRSPDGTTRGQLSMGFSLEKVEAAWQDNRVFGALVAVGLALVAWVTMALVSTSITLPIQRLTRTAMQVAEGRLDLVQLDATAIPPHTRDEVGQLSRAMATMLERLKAGQDKLEERIRAEEEERREAERQRAQAEDHQQRLREALDLVEQTQAQLVDAEKLATLGQLVAGIAHEVNTPLGAITASGTIVEEGLIPALDDWRAAFPDSTTDAARAAGRVVRGALDREGRPSSRVQRRLRREAHAALVAAGVEAPASAAERMVEVGLAPDHPDARTLLSHPRPAEALAAIDAMATVLRNAANIRTAAQRARTVVQALKTFARTGDSAEQAPIDVVASISTVLTLYNSQLRHGVEVDLEFDAGAVVVGNPDELAQVWTNLLQNALHAMDRRGVLRIAVRATGGRVVTTFSNDGPPIPDSVLPRIFEAFYTTKPRGEGSGLGLDIVAKVVERHDGRISVTSTEAWTTFTVDLPAQPGPPA